MSEEEPKYNMVGYGTFMTQSLSGFDGSLDSQTYGVPIKIVKPVLIKGYRRVASPHSGFPYVVEDKDSEFWGLAFTIVGDKNLERLDRVEGVPNHYTRETVKVDGVEHFLYVASANVQKYDIKYLIKELPKDKDYWYTRVYMAIAGNPVAMSNELFVPLMNRDMIEDEVLNRYNYSRDDDDDDDDEDIDYPDDDEDENEP